jgi:hypothetical protein
MHNLITQLIRKEKFFISNKVDNHFKITERIYFLKNLNLELSIFGSERCKNKEASKMKATKISIAWIFI